MLEWAKDNAVADKFFRVVNCTGLTQYPHAIGRVFVALDSAVAQKQLLLWGSKNEYAQTLRDLSQLRGIQDPRLSKYRPLTDVVPATEYITENISSYYLLGLLLARLPAVDPGRQEWFERLRLWLFVHCIERAALGNTQDRNLELVCSKLRLAHDGIASWLELFEKLRTDSQGFESMGILLASSAKQLLDARASESKLTSTQRRLLDSLVCVSCHEHAPKLMGYCFPLPIGEIQRSQEGFWSDATDSWAEGNEAFSKEAPAEKLLAGDGESGDTRKIRVDERASYAHQQLQANSVLLAAAEDLHFLPWSWNRPNPIELTQLHDWIRAGLASIDPARKAIAVYTLLAVLTGRTLRRTLDIALGSTPGAEWTLDLDNMRLLRTPPRRIPGWQPGTDVEQAWVAPMANIICIVVPESAGAFLRNLLHDSAEQRVLGDLWNAIWGASPESAFLNFAKQDLPRLSPAMLANVLPQFLYLKTGDSVFARMLSSHPRSGLPGSTAYASWNDSCVENEISRFVETLGIPKTESISNSTPLNALGSQLDVIEGLLMRAIAELEDKVEFTRQGTSLIGYHNAVTAKVLYKLYAATGARPLRDPFCNPRDFGFVDGTLFLDDKHSRKARTGRLIELPRVLASEIERDYLTHLDDMASALATQAPILSGEIARLAQGKESRVLPFFFLLGTPSGQIQWRHASEKNLSQLELFDCPLPLNLFRHRLATRLRYRGVDPELIDALLGHAEAGAASHGNHSFRNWQDDMSALRGNLDACFDELGFAPLLPRAPASQLPDFTEDPSANPLVFGAKDRAQRRWERTRTAISQARSIIIAHRKGRSLGELNQEEMDALARALLTNEQGLPHSLAALRFSVLVREADRLNRKEGKKVRIRHRYRQLEEETSVFTADGPGALGLYDRLRQDAAMLVAQLPQLRLGDMDSTIIGAVLLMIESRIADRKLIRDFLGGIDIRLIRARPGFYLEHGKKLNKTDPAAAIHRHRITNAAARLVNKALGRAQTRSFDSLSIPKPLLELTGHLVAEHRLRENPKVSHLIASLADVIDQVNVRSLPGAVAGYLGGRVTSVSLEWRDWVRVRWNQRISADSSFDQPPDLDPENTLPGNAPGTEDIEQLQREARELFKALRKDLAPDDGASNLDANARRKIAAAMRKTLADRDGKAPRACLWLGHWVASLLSRKTRKDAFLVLSAIQRYFTALSPAFESLGHNFDPELANEDDITDFYSEVLESRKLENIEFVFGRLREFHQWLSNLIEVDEPVWAELPFFDGSVAVDPGVITESDYLSAFNSLARCAATNETARFAAFLLLGAYRFGMRGGEALGLLRSDWISLGQSAMVVVQNNRYRKLKRPASRRVIPLVSELTPAEHKLITWIHAAAEAGAGDDMSAMLLPAVNRRAQQQIRRVALNALKSATGNPASNIHRLRHSAANQILLSLAGIDRELWNKTTRLDSRKVQDLLLGREGSTRRVAWAAARYLGHAGPDTAFRSYYHCISDLAEKLIGLPSESPKQLSHAIDLENFPRQTLATTSRLATSQAPGTAGVKDSIKALRLLARGKSTDEIASWLGQTTEQIARLEAAAATVNLRMYWPSNNQNDDSPHRLEWLKRIRHDGWGRLLRRAGEIDTQFPQGLPEAVSLSAAEKMVGRSRQLLAWRQEHFSALSALVEHWGIARDQFAVLMTGESARLKTLATGIGFPPGNAKTHGARVAGQQIDAAFDDDEQLLRVAVRCALCLAENDKASTRNRFELIAALFAISAITGGN